MNTCETKSTVQQPAFTTREDETGIHLLIALPGVRKEDLKLSVKESVLTIEATRDRQVPENWTTHSAPPESVTYRLHARLTARFDGGQAKASLENGVLTLDVPIREEAKARQISVS